MAHRNGIGEAKDIILYYLSAYGPSSKWHIREELRTAFPEIPFKTFDAIDKHLKDLIERGYITHDETHDLFSLTDYAKLQIYANLEIEQMQRELNDLNYHFQMQEQREKVNRIIVKSIIELKENGYTKPF